MIYHKSAPSKRLDLSRWNRNQKQHRRKRSFHCQMDQSLWNGSILVTSRSQCQNPSKPDLHPGGRKLKTWVLEWIAVMPMIGHRFSTLIEFCIWMCILVYKLDIGIFMYHICYASWIGYISLSLKSCDLFGTSHGPGPCTQLLQDAHWVRPATQGVP